jgi:hypothetical protein
MNRRDIRMTPPQLVAFETSMAKTRFHQLSF